MEHTVGPFLPKLAFIKLIESRLAPTPIFLHEDRLKSWVICNVKKAINGIVKDLCADWSKDIMELVEFTGIPCMHRRANDIHSLYASALAKSVLLSFSDAIYVVHLTEGPKVGGYLIRPRVQLLKVHTNVRTHSAKSLTHLAQSRRKQFTLDEFYCQPNGLLLLNPLEPDTDKLHSWRCHATV